MPWTSRPFALQGISAEACGTVGTESRIGLALVGSGRAGCLDEEQPARFTMSLCGHPAGLDLRRHCPVDAVEEALASGISAQSCRRTMANLAPVERRSALRQAPAMDLLVFRKTNDGLHSTHAAIGSGDTRGAIRRGLGLAIVSRIVADHHGSFTLERKLRAGTVATVGLPVCDRRTMTASIGDLRPGVSHRPLGR